MKKTLLGLLVFLTLGCAAQMKQNHWFMGTYLGMRFNGGGMSVIPVNTSKMYAPYGSAVYSHPKSGQLLFYTNGSYVFNRQHKQMPNGFYINDDTYSIHTVIVPHPTDSNLFYIIASATNIKRLYYATVDMRLQGGQGDVVEKAKLLDSNADLPFCVVKQYYDEGYWLITHVSGTNQFKTYRIGAKGLETTPVLSDAGSVTPTAAGFAYGKMVSNAKGDKFTFTHGSINTLAICEEFIFDKKCGTVSLKQSFFPHILQADAIGAFPAYSRDDSKLYVNWLYNSGQVVLVQFNLKENNPNSNYVVVNQNDRGNGDLQLAPDGKIYVATSENGMVSPKVSLIQNPNALGTACGFVDKAVLLANNTTLYFTEHFPEFIMDVSAQPKGYEKPQMVFENVCENQPVSFSLKDSVFADSVLWMLGDGYTTTQLRGTHTYAGVGDYVVTFNWYLCDQQYSKIDTVKVRSLPIVKLGSDTTLCAGSAMVLRGPDSADTYKWSSGQTTRNITVTQAGTYRVKVWNGMCWAEDAINVNYYDPLWTALGDEFFLCEDDKELVKLDAGEHFTQYKWSPTGDTTQWIIVGDVGDYFVVVKDFRGCSGQDGTKVRRRCPVTVYFPNAFTPNNDGINDVYQPTGKDVVSFSMTIYNRWGQMVFETSDINRLWDGKVKSEFAPTDTYFYMATYSGYLNKRLNEFSEKGSFTLIR